mmetsp:Transcript_36616/g.103384  ORF Transcript_36616/g.103384 Transcript_36616/m.103384 type:complete len:327 (+) Transcript_36616:382-1362(+)
MTRNSPLYGLPQRLADEDVLAAEFERAAADFDDMDSSGKMGVPSMPTITVEQSIGYLNQTLPSFGITSAVRLGGLDSDDAASICNILHTLIFQRQKEQDYRRVSEEQLTRLRNEVQQLENSKTRIANKLEAQERENGACMIKERQLKQSHDAALKKVTIERDSLAKANAGLQRKCTQMSHEIKRKELERQKLGERLTSILADKRKAEAKAGVELERALQRSSSASSAPSPAMSPRGVSPAAGRRSKIDEDMFKTVVGAYEAKHKELQEENQDLRATLSALQVPLPPPSASTPSCRDFLVFAFWGREGVARVWRNKERTQPPSLCAG